MKIILVCFVVYIIVLAAAVVVARRDFAPVQKDPITFCYDETGDWYLPCFVVPLTDAESRA